MSGDGNPGTGVGAAAETAADAGGLTFLVTGATGLVGSALCPFLEAAGHRVLRLTRSPRGEGDLGWDPLRGEIDLPADARVDAAVHLAGENIASGRWTRTRRGRIMESRREGTRLLAAGLAGLDRRPEVLVSASGTNVYPAGTERPCDESETVAGGGFLAEVCREWEASLAPAAEAGIRVVALRTGVVLSPDGGALAKLLPIFKLGLGGRVGDGAQRMSWIALVDLVEIYLRAATDARFQGVVNAVAPEPATNVEFTRVLAAALGRPAFLPVPAFALRAVFGQMADETILADLAVAPGKLLQLGFTYQCPDLAAALEPLRGGLIGVARSAGG